MLFQWYNYYIVLIKSQKRKMGEEYGRYRFVNLRDCRVIISFDLYTITSIQKACVPLGAYEAQGKCINDFKMRFLRSIQPNGDNQWDLVSMLY